MRRSLRANSLLAFAGDLAGKLGQLVVLVICARLLDIEQFAALGVALAVVGVGVSVLDGGASLLIQRDGAGDPAVRRQLLRALLRARIPFFAVVVVACVIWGVLAEDPLTSSLVGISCVVSALSLSLWAVVRAAEDFRPETSQRLVVTLIASTTALAGAALIGQAWVVLAGLTVGAAAVLPWAVAVARRAGAPGGRPLSALGSLRAAVPLGAMGVATLVYYRAPTLFLGGLGDATQTARFTAAATIAFGLLMIPNAITSGLLPRLAASGEVERIAILRSALGWTLLIGFAIQALTAAVAPQLLVIGFGYDFAAGADALVLMLAATFLISASSVIGVCLLASGRTRVLGIQVAATLIVNLLACLVLIPPFGEEGAAVAVLISEALALAIIGPIGARLYPGLWRCPAQTVLACVLALGLVAAGLVAGGPLRIPVVVAGVLVAVLAHPQARRQVVALARRAGALRLGVCAGLAALGGLWAWATVTGYGLRVISDSPSFMVIVRALGARPLEPVNPFLASGDVANSHATPYTQLLGFGWRWLGIEDLSDPLDVHPVALYRYLAVVGLAVCALTLHAVFVFVRAQAGSRAAWWSIPVLLVVLGPAHVIWASDLSFHGFLYGAYFPQNVAIALALYALVVLGGGSGVGRIIAGIALSGACLVVHPFTGVLLALLLVVLGARAAFASESRWWRYPLSFCVGLALGQLWPAYSLDQALAESGARGIVIGAGVALACVGAWALGRLPAATVTTPAGTLARRALEVVGRRGAIPLAVVGLITMVTLAAWQVWLVDQPNPDPLINSNRLAVYWVEDRWRWPLMFCAGFAGIAGLARLALRGRPLCAWWAALMLGVGFAGMAGLPLPVWWRFLLFAQIPLACGVAVLLAEAGPTLRRLVAGGLTGSLAFKLMLLLALSSSLTYFNTGLQPSWSLAQVIPHRPGVVASDPFSSYLVSAASGHRVLTVTKSHVGSKRELAASEEAYRLLHRFYSDDEHYWEAAREMYRRGVRFVLVEKSTLLSAPDLVTFSTGPTPLVRTEEDRRSLGTYYYHLNQVADLRYDHTPYALFELDPALLFPEGVPPA